MMSCAGNSSEICGGANRLNLYLRNGTAGGGPTSGPTVVPSVGNFRSLGCYSEGTGSRALTGRAVANANMTVEGCAAACGAYQYFGVEYSTEVSKPRGTRQLNYGG